MFVLPAPDTTTSFQLSVNLTFELLNPKKKELPEFADVHSATWCPSFVQCQCGNEYHLLGLH